MTGIDILSTVRTEIILKYYREFLTNCFSDAEREYFSSRGNNPELISCALSLKEAALKALGAEKTEDGYKFVEFAFDGSGLPASVTIGGKCAGLLEAEERLDFGVLNTERVSVAYAEVVKTENNVSEDK